ncbi:MAG: PhoH family protein [Lachnospiraceae bacterium]|nr:PhoH family protein [Lachnospiraceae bacterium]
MNLLESMIELSISDQQLIFGQLDSYKKIIEKTLNVTIIARDDQVKLIGDSKAIAVTKYVLNELKGIVARNGLLTEQNVNYVLALSMEEYKHADLKTLDEDLICHTIQGKPIKPKTFGQKNYVELIRNKMIVFGVGPAGTGKTYLAMAMAVNAFKNDEVSRIILTRPAIEAGEKLGFLPGDLQSKIDPYLRPLYDALYQIMGPESYQRNSEKGLIEVAPLAYMRGRTLDNSFIILDEAQNTTPAQMKMFLTRIGFGSKVIITGDLTQKDLPAGTTSGLDHAMRVLGKIDDIGFAKLTSQDVVRHPLVQKIVKAYDSYESKKAKYANQQTRNKKKRVLERVKDAEK